MITVGKRKQWWEDWETAIFEPDREKPEHATSMPNPDPHTPWEEAPYVLGLDGKPIPPKAAPLPVFDPEDIV